MAATRAELALRLDLLRARTCSDFAAVAVYGRDTDRMVRWVSASGNMNTRYTHMQERTGAGIGGWIVRHGRPLSLGGGALGDGRPLREYPLLVAERLLTAAGVPIHGGIGVDGALLIGRRTAEPFEAAHWLLLEEEAKHYVAVAWHESGLTVV